MKRIFGLMIVIFFLSRFTSIVMGQSTTVVPLPGVDSVYGDPTGAIDLWQMFRHDSRHTGYVTARAPMTPTILWKVNVGIPLYSSPAIANKTVFFGAKDVLIAIDERNGSTLWKAPMVGEIYSSPAVDPQAGKQGMVYAASYGSRSSTLSAFDMLNGSLIWTTWMTTRSSPAIAFNPPIDIYPNVPRCSLFIGAGYYMNALDADTGKSLWTFDASGLIDSSPAVDLQRVYFGTNSNFIFALSRYTGLPLWKFEAKAAVSSSPAVGDKLLIAASVDGTLYCLDKASGKLIWMIPTGGAILSSPAYYKGFIYIGSGSALLKIDETGKIIWSSSVLGDAGSSPALSSGRVYMGSSRSKSSSIFCFDDLTSASVWSKWMEIESSPSLAYWSLIVTTLDGYVYCFNDLE